MSRQIEVSEAVYRRLEGHAHGFDTPSIVIERILDAFDQGTRGVKLTSREGPLTEEPRPLDNSDIQNRVSRALSLMTQEEVDRFCDKQYSRRVIGTSFPLLVKVPLAADSATRSAAVRDKGINRWTWKYHFRKGDFIYAICTQWFRSNDDQVRRWLKEHEQST